MSNPLALKEDDLRQLLTAQCHIGAKNADPQMRRYVWRRRNDGVHVINLGKTWEKLILAARVIVAIENPEDVVVISALTVGQRAVFKFAQHTGSSYVGGRYTPGTFTNQIQKKYMEPRLLLVTDPLTDSQPVKEASYVNIPVIAFADVDSPLDHVDIAIPCNNKSKTSVALMYWLLAREVLRMRAALPRSEPWSVMMDLFLYREPEEVKEAQDAAAAAAEEVVAAPIQHEALQAEVVAQDFTALGVAAPKVGEWGAEEANYETNAAPQQNWQAPQQGQPQAQQNWQQQAPAAQQQAPPQQQEQQPMQTNDAPGGSTWQ